MTHRAREGRRNVATCARVEEGRANAVRVTCGRSRRLEVHGIPPSQGQPGGGTVRASQGPEGGSGVLSSVL